MTSKTSTELGVVALSVIEDCPSSKPMSTIVVLVPDSEFLSKKMLKNISEVERQDNVLSKGAYCTRLRT